MSALLAFLLLKTPVITFAENYYASIIIDDLGTSYERGYEIAALPAAITLAILPNTEHAATIARLGAEQDKEIMLHLPMQSVAHHRHSPGTLSLHMTQPEFIAQVKQNIASVPHIKGINNHMGSLMTRHPGYMTWLMETIAAEEDLYFVDSRTTDKSIAMTLAEEHLIPGMSRDIFLDPDYSTRTLNRQFERFISTIKEKGSAVAIAHPHPNSITLLRNRLAELAQHNIKLVPVSDLIRYRGESHVTCTGPACSGM